MNEGQPSKAKADLQSTTLPAFQAFFCSDACPMNNFFFFDHIARAVGHAPPPAWLSLPTLLVYAMAFLLECLYLFVDYSPLLTRAEVLKTSVTHWFRQDRIQSGLGYRPLVLFPVAISRTAAYFASRWKGNGPVSERE